MSVLVTGGAGYIGSHVVRSLLQSGRDVVVVDDLSTGERSRLDDVVLEQLDLASPDAAPLLAETMHRHDVSAVIHLAALKQVAESVSQPTRYFRVNIDSTAAVLDAMAAAGASSIVFSSSAAVYGSPVQLPVAEDAVPAPENPYGESKLAGEWLVRAACRATGIRGVSLRYFNVAGAGWGDLGDSAPLNLLTIAIDAIQRGEPVNVNGDDYPTPDGTPVRDYVHVLDLAAAHVAALDALEAGQDLSPALNIGTGTGYSVRELLDQLETSCGPFLRRVAPRRPGDTAEVVADPRRAERELGWRATRGLEEMTRSAWESAEQRASRR